VPLSITGYVLEPPRVGQANSPFTQTPNDLISDQGSFDVAYPPSIESNPRTDYLVFVAQDGKLADAYFYWTKNEGAVQSGVQVTFARFDYSGKDQRFKTLPGSGPVTLGTLGPDSNTTRFKVVVPQLTNLTNFPARLSAGSGSGTDFTIALVQNEAAFTPQTPGNVQVAQAEGTVNWCTSDLTTYGGQTVRFQQQAFFSYDKSNGRVGLIDDVLLLTPVPGTSQIPLLRIGYGAYLSTISVADDSGLSPPPSAGYVKWSRATGRLAFSTADIAANSGRPVYYDGVAFGLLTVDLQAFGTVSSPGVFSPVPSESADVFFRIPGLTQFAQTVFVDAFDPVGKRGVVQVRRSDGHVQFSASDQAAYGPQSLQAIIGDIAVNHGISLRLFRTPVDPGATDPDIKDVAALYKSTNAVLASPIMASPFVFLPAVPYEGASIAVRCSSLGTDLPRLDVPSPPAGLGYVLDFDGRQLVFAERKSTPAMSSLSPFGAMQVDPLVFASNLSLELETAPGSSVYVPLTVGEDVLFDYQAGLASFVETDGTLVTSGTAGQFTSLTTFTDSTADFSGVVPGDSLVILSGTTVKGVYSIASVPSSTAITTGEDGVVVDHLSYEIRHGYEVLADRYFRNVPPVDPNTKVERLRDIGAPQNTPTRLNIGVNFAGVSRFRFGKTTFAITLAVATNANFTAPSSLPQGTVQVSLATGDLNFSQADVTAGVHVYWARTLVLGTDYTLQPALGFIQFTERLLQGEETFVTYKNSDGAVVEERGTLIVRKELTVHAAPATTIPFNPLGHEVALNPPPKVFRGGRPQSSNQVSISASPSTITFLPSSQVTDALPAGPPVDPSEHVYIDYFIYDAIGGEDSLTVTQPPMQGVSVQISEMDATVDPPVPNNKFAILGDRTADFQESFLLRVDNSEVYLIGSSSYDGTQTTVTLASPQTFRSDFTNPGLAVSSGQTRVNPYLVYPSYFTTELSSRDTIARGSSKFNLAGDQTRNYVEGTVVLVTDGGSFVDFLLVTGSAYDKNLDQTAVTISGNAIRQYETTHTLKRSVRPVFSTPQAAATTKRVPTQAPTIFRRVEGQRGQVLIAEVDYKIDESGRVTFTDALIPNEQLAVFYTGHLIIEAGRHFRATYTHTIVPSDQNQLLGATLKMDYTTYIPDSFYWRIETMTNFRAELASQYEADAKASIPSGGPMLENTSSPKLFEQGRASIFFDEGHLLNEDIVARPTLKFYNDQINLLEDCLESMDGRVVGDRDGRFVFDGLITNPPRTSWASVTNQIDDTIKVSDAPYAVSFSLSTFTFSVTSIGTYLKAYEPAPTSRFYPTSRRSYGVTTPTAGLNTGDTIMDIGFKNLSGLTLVKRRDPWAVVTVAAKAGVGVLYVDAAKGAESLLRPGLNLAASMKVAIVAQDGTVLVTDASPLTISSVTTTSVSFTTSLAVDIPAGATVRIADTDTAYRKFYRPGLDVGVDLENGHLTYVQPFPPLDGSLSPTPIPTELCVTPPASAGGEVLDVSIGLNNSITAPYRFPALDGGTSDDDGDRQFPILTPSAKSESAKDYGYLRLEKAVVQSGSPLRVAVTMPFVGTGNVLSSDLTKIVNTGGLWPFPLPQVDDLVRVLSGANDTTHFYRITAVGASDITVNTTLVVDTGFDFTVTVSNSLVTSGAGTFTTTTLTDLLQDFNLEGVKPGHTVVITSGAYSGSRRQVVSVVSGTQLSITAIPGGGSFSYRVDNPLGTFGGTNSIVDTNLIPALNGELAVLDTNTIPSHPWSERQGIEQFWSLVLATFMTSGNGSATMGSPVLTDLTQDFLALGVNATQIVFIHWGSDGGFYQIQTIAQHTLTVDRPFPVDDPAIGYQVVSASLISAASLEALYVAWQGITQAISDVTTFRNTIMTAIPVQGDAGAYARGTLQADLDTRSAQATARLTNLDDTAAGPPVTISAVMSAGDRLYDKRFTWIDARINLEKGILVKQSRAVANRIKAQADTLNQLVKLLTVQP
jgi:hypothetical protein